MNDSALLTLINGQQANQVSVNDRGFNYGDGLFETMLVCAGKIPLLDRHWQRLELGLQRLKISQSLPELQQELNSVCEQIANHKHAVIKLMVTRGEGARGYRASATLPPTRIISAFSYPAYASQNWQGIWAYRCEHRYASSEMLAGIKHLNRLDNVLARREWDSDQMAEGLIRSQDGKFVSGCFTNLFIVAGSRLLTPEILDAGVRGVMRQTVLEDWASDLGLEVAEVTVSDAAIRDADELFLTNALIGAWPICEFAGQSFPYGRICQQIQARFAALTGIDHARH